MVDRAALDVDRPAKLRALLQALEARTAALVEDDDFAVHDEPFERQRLRGPSDLGKRRRDVASAPIEEVRFAGLARDE